MVQVKSAQVHHVYDLYQNSSNQSMGIIPRMSQHRYVQTNSACAFSGSISFNLPADSFLGPIMLGFELPATSSNQTLVAQLAENLVQNIRVRLGGKVH